MTHVNQALELYLKKARKDLEPQRWLFQPSNFISLVAITLSLLGVVYQGYKDRRDAVDRDRVSLSLVITELTKLDAEVAAWDPPIPGFRASRRLQ